MHELFFHLGTKTRILMKEFSPISEVKKQQNHNTKIDNRVWHKVAYVFGLCLSGEGFLLIFNSLRIKKEVLHNKS
jgi:hypothetical protein